MARRVLTEAGAKYFGKPIGSFISPDEEDDAKAQHGGRAAPPRAVTGSNQKRAGTSDDNSLNSDKPTTSSEPEKAPTSKTTEKKVDTPTTETSVEVEMVSSTITGPRSVTVGRSSIKVPEGSEVFKSPTHSGRMYIVTPEGDAHVFTSKGELNLTPEQRKALATQISETLQAEEAEVEEDEQKVTWIRLLSIARLLAQAEKTGDTSQVKKLEKQFREGLSSYRPEADPRTVRKEIAEKA